MSQSLDSNVTLAKQQFARVSVLAAKNYASRQQYDEDAAALSTAEASSRSRQGGFGPDQGWTDEGRTRRRAEPGCACAGDGCHLEAQLAKTTLTSPIDGVARLLVAEQGEAISPGQPVLTLAAGGTAGSRSRSARTVFKA